MKKVPKRCPKCNIILPLVRAPTSLYQVLWGGWTCPNPECEVELDRKGNLRKEK